MTQGGMEQFVDHHPIKFIRFYVAGKIWVEANLPAIGTCRQDTLIHLVLDKKGQCSKERLTGAKTHQAGFNAKGRLFGAHAA